MEIKFTNTQDDRNPMKITQAFRIESAHSLPFVPKTHKCHNLHGHTYRIELTFEGEIDKDTGFVIDFFDVEKDFESLRLELDHHYLNDVNGLENPTVENISRWIFHKMDNKLLSSVRVYENPDCWAEYNG